MVFESVLDMVSQERGEIKKSWFVDWFYGNALKSNWLFTQGSPNITSSMTDEINGGFELLTTLINSSSGFIDFGDKRHYSPTGGVFVAIVTSTPITDYFTFIGLIDIVVGTTDAMFFRLDSLTAPNIIFRTQETLVTEIDTGVAQDTNSHRYEGQLTSTRANGFIDGILRATITTNLPLTKLQPFMRQGTRAVANQTAGKIRYFEAYNK